MSSVTFRWSLIALTTRYSRERTVIQSSVYRRRRRGQFGSGVDGEFGDGAVSVLEGEVEIEIVAVG